jgi:ATP-dependent protease ClpP protease subunit
MSKKVITKASDEDEEYVDGFNVSFVPHKTGIYRIEIDKTISTVGQFSNAIQILQMAKEGDEVEIHLQCPGGSVHATGALLHAMKKCEAPIHIIATGACHSAATMILLSGDSFELSEDFNALIHGGSLGSIGNLNEYHAEIAFLPEFINNIHRRIYEGFLTPEEIENLVKGQDFWLDANGWCERQKARNEYFKAKAEKAKKPPRKPRKPKSQQSE